MDKMGQRPIEVARQRSGLEPVSIIESWNEKNIEIAFWRLAGPRAMKIAPVNHFASFAITDIGNQTLLDADGRTLRVGPIAAGRFRLVQAATCCESRIESPAPMELLDIFFSPRLLRQFATEYGLRTPAVTFNDPLWGDSDELLAKLASSVVEDMQSSNPADRLFAQETAMLILHRMLLKHSSLAQPGSAGGRCERGDFDKVIEFMADNLDRPVTVDQLASLTGMSTFAFIRGFSKRFGVTPMRHVRLLRLEKAKDMLLRTSLPIASVSQRLGFSDSAHFIAAFKRDAGVTPRAYRLASSPNAGV
jgi:AraC family transcriptional regulator